MIVDDEELVRSAVRCGLTRYGIETIGIADASGALATDLERVDAMLLDVYLSGHRIEPFIPELRERAPWAPLVVWTGRATAAEGARLRDLGAHLVIDKPAWPAVVRGTLERAARELFGLASRGPVDLAGLEPSVRARLITRALSCADGCATKAAALLGHSRQRFQYWEKQITAV